MRCVTIVLACIVGMLGPALAETCPGNPNALGTSRTIVVDARTQLHIGAMNFFPSLPLEDHEVVLTFDDGPRPPYTQQILAALAHECVKATFFMVGYMARASPATVRAVYNAGHSIGSHSQNHLIHFSGLDPNGINSEVGGGFATLAAALGDPRAVSPFFRAPGLANNRFLDGYLVPHSISLWSTDAHGWDWTHIGPAEIIRRAIAMLDAKGRGVLLLHDLHPETAAAMPQLLRELKAHGFKVVAAVAPGDRPAFIPEPAGPPAQPVPAAPLVTDGWPRVMPPPANPSEKAPPDQLAATSSDGRGLPAETGAATAVATMGRSPVTFVRGFTLVKRTAQPGRWTLVGASANKVLNRD